MQFGVEVNSVPVASGARDRAGGPGNGSAVAGDHAGLKSLYLPGNVRVRRWEVEDGSHWNPFSNPRLSGAARVLSTGGYGSGLTFAAEVRELQQGPPQMSDPPAILQLPARHPVERKDLAREAP